MKNDISSTKRAAKTVLELVSVLATSGKEVLGKDMEAIEILQEIGFINLKASGKQISAEISRGEEVFLVEYDGAQASNQKPFKLIQMRQGSCKEIDSGRTIYIQDSASAGGIIEVLVRGDRLSEWQFFCRKTSLTTIEAYNLIVRTKGVLPYKAYLPAPTYREEMGPSCSKEVVSTDEIHKLPPDSKPETKVVSGEKKVQHMEMVIALLEKQNSGATPKELSVLCGKTLPWVYANLSLRKLDPKLLVLMDPRLPRSGRLSFSIAQQLVRVPLEQQMGLYLEISKIKGATLQVLEAKRLVAEVVSETPVDRRNKSADFCKSLKAMVPRFVANALIADGYPDSVFASLVGSHRQEDVDLMLQQIATTVQKLQLLDGRIRKALGNVVLAHSNP